MPATEEYLRIELATPCLTEAEGEAAVAALNGMFDPDEFFVAASGGRWELYLRQVDTQELIAAADRVSVRYGNQELLAELVSAVENIRSYGLNGKKRLYVGYNRERKVVDRKNKELRRGKHFYANDHDFWPTETSLPAQFTDRIICGDSESVLRELPDNCIDLVFTSPPYNFGLAYDAPNSDNAGDAYDWETYFAKLFAVFEQCIRVLKTGGRIVVNVQPLFSDYIPSHHIISSFFMERRLIWKGEILWEKNNYNCKYTAWGSWKSPSSPYLKYTWEFLEVFCKGALKKKGRSVDADIDADSFKEWVNAKWSIAPERRMKEFNHPAMFPEELARRVMLLFSFRGDTVLDPFNGAGTTTLVARKNDRRFLGIDTAAEYCETAQQRLAGTQLQFVRE